MEFLLIAWIIGFFVCAFVASQRGRSGIAWGLISLLISPLLALLVLIAIPSNRRATRRGRTRNSYDDEDEGEEEEEERPSARYEDPDRRRSPETAILRGLGGVLLVIGVSVVIVSFRACRPGRRARLRKNWFWNTDTSFHGARAGAHLGR